MKPDYNQLLEIIQKQQKSIDDLLRFKDDYYSQRRTLFTYFKNIVQFDKESKVGLFGADPVSKITGLTLITHTSPSTPDYAIQDLTNSSGYGFVTKDEGNTLLSVVKNIQQALKSLGITT